MKKRILLGITAVICALALTACGSKKGSDVSVDIEKLAADLTATVTSDTLSSVSADIMASTYFFDMEKVEEGTAALNSGASACEVAVVKCSDSAYVSEAENLFKTRVKNQSDLFADYNAPEVAKLDAALIESAGNYVVLCVTDDTKAAEEILKEAGF
ncbi:MAG: DUF4358 domain-containing protein [Eubacteriales bacterium]|nr:DUF4358 domain-containing protein [Eubacteriales bacterium]